jgi:hypothetical protein
VLRWRPIIRTGNRSAATNGDIFPATGVAPLRGFPRGPERDCGSRTSGPCVTADPGRTNGPARQRAAGFKYYDKIIL